jgi:hypothetical protein
MNMNMKNEKTMLALIVVAALAMVSVAGVALATESDAASADVYSNNGTFNIATDYTGDFYVYIGLTDETAETANVTINVNSDAKFTGNVYFCTAKYVDGTTTDIVYDTIYNKVSFNAVSGVTIYTDAAKTPMVTVSGETTGTVTLEKGLVKLGSNDSTVEFTGKLVAGNASFDAVGISGAIVELGVKGSTTTTYLYGYVAGFGSDISNVLSPSVKTVKLPTLAASGKFTINKDSNVETVFYGMVFEVTKDSTATVYSKNGTSTELQNDGVFIVNGTVVVTDTVTGADIDAIDNNGYMIVNGVVKYTTKDSIAESPIDEVWDIKLWAAYYKVTDNNAGTTTHYYTDLSSAMAASEDVTLYGFKLITSDMTIKDSLTLGEGAIMVVGVPDVKLDIAALAKNLIPEEYLNIINTIFNYIGYSFSDLSASSPTVSVAAGAEFDVTGAEAMIVLSGKLSVDQDAKEIDSLKVYATVEMKEGTNTIYTNLDTALSLAKSGDTIELRMIGYIFKDATIASGVTVELSDSGVIKSGTFGKDVLIVYCGTTLNVNGTLDLGNWGSLWIMPGADAKVSYTTDDVEYSATVKLDAATLNVNKGAVITTNYVLLGGVLNIASDFDNINGKDKFNVNQIDVFTYVYDSDDGDNEISTDINSAVMNVDGKFNTEATIEANDHSEYDDPYNSVLTVNVNGEFKTKGSFNDGGLLSTINVKGQFMPTKYSTESTVDSVVYVNVSGKGIVSGDLDVTGKLVSGTVSDSFTENVNNTTVKINGDVGLAIVYGTPADKAISISSGDNAAQSVYYLVTPEGSNIVYLTMYTTTTSDDVEMVYYIPDVTGYEFVSWNDADGEIVKKTDMEGKGIGECEEVYGNFVIKTMKVTLTYAQNGTWIIDGVDYTSGTMNLDFGTHTISFLPSNGYELSKDFAMYVNGVKVTDSFVVDDKDITVTFSGEVKEKTVSEGMDLVTILLIVITIVIVVMAIIIAMKLMRS